MSSPSDWASWHRLPAEIRLEILECLLQDGCSVANFAAVSREWQQVIERKNFARITVTLSRLAEFNSMTLRNRALVSYIWLCIELEEYDCTKCGVAVEEYGLCIMSKADHVRIARTFTNLFSALGAWQPNGNLMLDISFHSPSDSDHWFKYLTFIPDTSAEHYDWNRRLPKPTQANFDDKRHGWIAGHRVSSPEPVLIEDMFGGIECFVPRAHEVNSQEAGSMTENYSHSFETEYPQQWQWLEGIVDLKEAESCKPVRIPTPKVSKAIAHASFKLEHLSASFLVDASHFFSGCKPSRKWRKLSSLALTSRLLGPNASTTEIGVMLRTAAKVAMRMPKLRVMEIWNGREGLAALFQYKSMGHGQRPVITWRATWDYALQPSVIRAWEAVGIEHQGKHDWNDCVVVKEILNVGAVRCHGDAIHHLKLSSSVIRPVSLHQIRTESRILDGVYEW
ncbi:hypothetical protein CcaCcLH18_06240 [Colletotrichum camelliae]|nr:hypothetical protein CcaCcLH18_06240 [Colletotrichum camelliae]